VERVLGEGQLEALRSQRTVVSLREHVGGRVERWELQGTTNKASADPFHIYRHDSGITSARPWI